MSSSRPNSKYYGHERVPSSSRPRVASTAQESHSNSHSHSRSQSTSKAGERRIERNNVLTRESVTVKRGPARHTESRSNSRRSRDGKQTAVSAPSTPTTAEPKKEERGMLCRIGRMQLLTLS